MQITKSIKLATLASVAITTGIINQAPATATDLDFGHVGIFSQQEINEVRGAFNKAKFASDKVNKEVNDFWNVRRSRRRARFDRNPFLTKWFGISVSHYQIKKFRNRTKDIRDSLNSRSWKIRKAGSNGLCSNPNRMWIATPKVHTLRLCSRFFNAGSHNAFSSENERSKRQAAEVVKAAATIRRGLVIDYSPFSGVQGNRGGFQLRSVIAGSIANNKPRQAKKSRNNYYFGYLQLMN